MANASKEAGSTIGDNNNDNGDAADNDLAQQALSLRLEIMPLSSGGEGLLRSCLSQSALHHLAPWAVRTLFAPLDKSQQASECCVSLTRRYRFMFDDVCQLLEVDEREADVVRATLLLVRSLLSGANPKRSFGFLGSAEVLPHLGRLMAIKEADDGDDHRAPKGGEDSAEDIVPDILWEGLLSVETDDERPLGRGPPKVDGGDAGPAGQVRRLPVVVRCDPRVLHRMFLECIAWGLLQFRFWCRVLRLALEILFFTGDGTMNGRSIAVLLKSMVVMLDLQVEYDAYLSPYGVILGYSTACSWSASRGACSAWWSIRTSASRGACSAWWSIRTTRIGIDGVEKVLAENVQPAYEEANGRDFLCARDVLVEIDS